MGTRVSYTVATPHVIIHCVPDLQEEEIRAKRSEKRTDALSVSAAVTKQPSLTGLNI